MAEHVVQPQHAKEAFPRDVLERISKVIAEVESSTNAEIRISIREMREASEADLSIREVAMKEFANLRMHETVERTGILLLILFDERKFFIFGDEGVNRHVDTTTWEDVAKTLQQHFRAARFEAGVTTALRKIEGHLQGLLPKRSSSDNQLSDEVVVR